MIYIFVAMYCEAKPIIERLNLSRCMEIKKIQVFKNDEYILTITGLGSVQGAIAVTHTCTIFRPKEEDILVNISVAAATKEYNIGEVVVSNKIIDKGTGRTFYPDMIYKHDFTETAISTYLTCVPIKEIMEYKNMLFDMEAAGIYQAGSMFFYVHNLIFLKIVSDYGVEENNRGITSEFITELVNKNLKKIFAYLDKIKDSNEQKNENQNINIENFVDRLAKDLFCSATMKNQLLQYIKYCSLTSLDYSTVVREFYNDGKLPCKNKKEGKIQFEKLKERLI